ncbi:hypothetical protein [Shinella pollutisoli]|uniref:Uncharacterized protein n=1 Tax=Shinella pollutisoli TaxID=2250594 RepID=A0ABV7DIZ3_9HYPH|nr:hypothetical protein [Shinella pollutisoli]
MATLDQREAATGRRRASDSRLPLIIQKKQREETTRTVVETASKAFTETLKRELKKLEPQR